MVYDVKELKEYFDKRFNELKNSLDVNNNALENFKSEIKRVVLKVRLKVLFSSKVNSDDNPKLTLNGNQVHQSSDF